jgi:hypothetical protein
LRQESGLYQGSLAYSQAVVAYHHIFDIEHCVFDQETVQQAHILMSHGNIASSDLLTQHEKPTAYFKLFVWIWLLLAIFMNIGERKADKQVTRTILNPLD